jgi:hypothetical protein
MPCRLSKSAAARLGLSPPKGAKRGPKKATPTPVWIAWGIPEPTPEFRFCERRWRFDFAWWGQVALEVDGGVWTRGRHSRGKGQITDMAKLNRAALLGWKVLRCTPQQLETGEIMPTIKKALGIS